MFLLTRKRAGTREVSRVPHATRSQLGQAPRLRWPAADSGPTLRKYRWYGFSVVLIEDVRSVMLWAPARAQEQTVVSSVVPIAGAPISFSIDIA